MPILTLISLKCVKQQEIGNDEAYIVVNGTKVWGPKDMDAGQTRPINVDRLFRYRAEIKLYDKDGLDPDDFLGKHEVTEAEVGERELTFDESGAIYKLWVAVSPDARKKQL
jgi:hypothetical protein